MLLEDEQYELLGKFIEAHRNAPKESRGAFLASQTMNEPQATFLHSRVHALRFRGSLSDAEVLADAGLLRMSYGSRGDRMFSVLPAGIDVYQQRMRSMGSVDVVNAEPHRYISDTEFRALHAVAFERWERATQLLWAADSAQNLTTIGHLCREALQEFATSLARSRRVDIAAIEPAKTVARIRKIIEASSTGTTRAEFLNALLAYWGTVSDLVQRQEHGAQREGEPLMWEDGRCVVFQTCIVMFEISRGLR